MNILIKTSLEAILNEGRFEDFSMKVLRDIVGPDTVVLETVEEAFLLLNMFRLAQARSPWDNGEGIVIIEGEQLKADMALVKKFNTKMEGFEAWIDKRRS